MRRHLLWCSVGLALATVACERSTAPAVTGPGGFAAGALTATRVAGGIELYNSTGTVLAYQISNRGWLGLLAPCSDPGINCATLVQGARRVVPISQISGADAGAFSEARVSYWSVVQGKTQPGAHDVIVAM